MMDRIPHLEGGKKVAEEVTILAFSLQVNTRNFWSSGEEERSSRPVSDYHQGEDV